MIQMEYIERETIRQFIRQYEDWRCPPTSEAIRAVNEIFNLVKKIPAADVAPVIHGYWTREIIRNEKGGCIGAKMICSNCGQDNKHDEHMFFCPNCGAKIDADIIPDNAEHCVCCGDVIPEGRQVCQKCEEGAG